MAAEFSQTLENEVLPLLRKQKGFKGEITLSNPGNLERISISLWDNKGNAEAYDANVYAQVLKILSKVIEGKPKIRIFESVALNLDSTVAER
jgi:phage terminase large subunit GpA-like protein